jgi:D-glycero-alpha-D-manno-heptose 1-phosphate guanylyltransferase
VHLKEAIVLAGGFGTRLRSVVGAIPKPMADIHGKPFLTYLLAFLKAHGIENVIMSVGFSADIIMEYFRDRFNGMTISYAEERRPLGTGGGLRYAMRFTRGEDVLVMNGDTLFLVDLKRLCDFHSSKSAAVTIALKCMERFDRYGMVVLEKNGRVVGFQEKRYVESGPINGGVYVVKQGLFDGNEFAERFSFENDFLSTHCLQSEIYGLVFDSYFIDIGIPEDYDQAKFDFKRLV